MFFKLTTSCLVAAALLLPIAGYSADSDRSSPTAFVKDSVITTKIKSELAAEKLSSLIHITVETDNKGAVVLGGTVTSKNAAEKAVTIAKAVKGVVSVDDQIKIVAAK